MGKKLSKKGRKLSKKLSNTVKKGAKGAKTVKKGAKEGSFQTNNNNTVIRLGIARKTSWVFFSLLETLGL